MECCLTEFTSSSPQETEALGERLAQQLPAHAIIALSGALGSGKTCLVKGLARGLGIRENITSPTYTIMNEYPFSLDGRTFTLHHIDAYRLNGDEDFNNTGAGECMDSGGITVIEWSERIPRSIPPCAINIHITITTADSRIFCIRGMENL